MYESSLSPFLTVRDFTGHCNTVQRVLLCSRPAFSHLQDFCVPHALGACFLFWMFTHFPCVASLTDVDHLTNLATFCLFGRTTAIQIVCLLVSWRCGFALSRHWEIMEMSYSLIGCANMWDFTRLSDNFCSLWNVSFGSLVNFWKEGAKSERDWTYLGVEFCFYFSPQRGCAIFFFLLSSMKV